MNSKDIQNKIEGLYANVDPNWKTKKDTYLIAGAIHSDHIKEKYKDPNYKKRWLKSQREKSNEIHEDSRKRLTKMNKERFAHIKYVFRTPGNDLLDFYDKMREKREATGKSQIKPSVIYQIRYVEQYEKGFMNARVREILSEHVDLSKQSECFCGDVRKRHMKWLTTEKSKQYTFSTQKEILDFLEKEYNTKSYIPINPTADKPVYEHMWWHGKLVGCSLIAVIT